MSAPLDGRPGRAMSEELIADQAVCHNLGQLPARNTIGQPLEPPWRFSGAVT